MTQISEHNHQKKIAVINDFSGFGRCSLAVALPVISTLKVQCCPLCRHPFFQIIPAFLLF